MSRKPRTPSPTDQYHVIIRGDEGLHIFQEEQERRFFLQALSEVLADTPASVLYAYCITNHRVNLVIQSGFYDLSHSMKRICTSFAIHYNRKKKRTGHVFQSRYQSIHIESIKHLIQTIKYLHNIPSAAEWNSKIEYKEGKALIINKYALELARYL